MVFVSYYENWILDVALQCDSKTLVPDDQTGFLEMGKQDRMYLSR